MKAVGFHASGVISRDDSLLDLELSEPEPGPRDLLVQVKAISVNQIDTKVRSSAKASEHKPRILGWDAAGIVIAVGAEVTRFKPGDKVFYAGEIELPPENRTLT